MGAAHELSKVLSELPRASSELLSERALLKRTDTKFVLHKGRLIEVLSRLDNTYAVVRVGELAYDRYETTYFDTIDFALLNQHLRDRRPRYKIRIRHYMGRRQSYLEIKKKTSSGDTQKWRRELPFGECVLSDESARFLNERCPLRASSLRPTAATNFDRIMLVGVDTMERVTLDVGLEFVSGSRSQQLNSVVIAEVKQARPFWRSPIMLALRSCHVRTLSISKYCATAALLIDGARAERYQPRVRELQRIAARSEHHVG